jgi:hypothetical protein
VAGDELIVKREGRKNFNIAPGFPFWLPVGAVITTPPSPQRSFDAVLDVVLAT